MIKYFSDTCNVLSRIEPVQEFPFPWAASGDCLPYDIYRELSATRPNLKREGEEGNNKRLDVRGRDLLKADFLAPIWKDFVGYHTSQDFYHQILDRFEYYFAEFYPQLKNMRDYKAGVRFGEEADIYLDCQLSVNTPVKIKSTVATPHVDNPESLWASLLYMREEGDDSGGDFVLHKCVKSPTFTGKRHADLDCIRPWGNVLYEPNHYVCFINSPLSIHSVTEREVTDKRRMMVNITLEFKDKQLFKV